MIVTLLLVSGFITLSLPRLLAFQTVTTVGTCPTKHYTGTYRINSFLAVHATKTTTTTTSTSTNRGRKVRIEQELDLLDGTNIILVIDRIESIPIGQLNDNETILLTKCWESLSNAKFDNVGIKSQVAQRMILRKIDEFNYIYQSDQSSSSKATRRTPSNDYLTIQDFITVLTIWEDFINDNNKNIDATSSALDDVILIYTKLINLYEQTQSPILQPDLYIFQIIFCIFEKSRERGIDQTANRIYKQMINNFMIQPNESIYHSLIVMTARSRERGAANRGEKLLLEAIEKFPPKLDNNNNNNTGGQSTGMTIDSFNVVLTAWAKSGLSYGPERAEKLIAYIEEIDQGQGVIKPTASSFTSLVDAYAQTNEWEGVSHGERVFNRVLDLHLSGEDNFEPSIVSWTIMMNAWTSLSKRGNRGAASRVNKLLQRMESLSAEGRISFKPDAIVYVTCINANAFAKTLEGAQAAQNILNEMNERYLDGDDSYRPSARCIKIVIEAWVKLNDMVSAEKVLNDYENHLTDFIDSNENPNWRTDVNEIYKSTIFGWSKIGNPLKAHATLLDMIDHGIEPDSFCFDRVIEANTQLNDSGAMKRSYEIFETMEQCRQRGMIKPNERVYSSFIRAMTRANIPRKAYKSRLLLRKMEKLYEQGNKGIKPTVFTYNAILMACSKCSPQQEQDERIEAMKIALEMFSELGNTTDGHDNVSFGNMLRCTNLLPQGAQKDALITSTFQLCCHRGLVNQFVLRDVKLCASDDLWERMFKCSKSTEINVDNLPQSWTRSIVAKVVAGNKRSYTR